MDGRIFGKDINGKRGGAAAGPDAAGGIVLTLFLCILIPAVSFYAPTGYQDLGEMKFRCFRAVSAVFALLLLPAVVQRAVKTLGEHGKGRRPILPVDAAAGACALLLIVSWLLAADRRESFWGTVGWRMGLFTQLMGFFIYFCCRLMRVRLRWILTSAELTAFVVFLFAVLNRLGIYPLPYMGVSPDFLSTIGNADWYAGYLAVFLPVFAADLFTALRPVDLGLSRTEEGPKKENAGRKTENTGEACRRLFVLLGLLTGLASAATQGTASGLLALCASAAVLLAAGLLIRGRRSATSAPDTKSKAFRIEAYGIIAALGFAFLIGLAIVWIHANADGEPARSLIAYLYFRHGIDFRAEWGNGRGVIWRLAGELYRGLPPLRRLFGVGPDGFPAWIGTQPQLLQSIGSYYGAVRVANAHCALFTAMIDEGVLFAVSLAVFYAALFFGFIRSLRGGSGDTDAAALCGAMMTASAAAQQMFTFRTVVTAPFFLAFAGILMRAVHRQERGNDIQGTDN